MFIRTSSRWWKDMSPATSALFTCTHTYVTAYTGSGAVLDIFYTLRCDAVQLKCPTVLFSMTWFLTGAVVPTMPLNMQLIQLVFGLETLKIYSNVRLFTNTPNLADEFISLICKRSTGHIICCIVGKLKDKHSYKKSQRQRYWNFILNRLNWMCGHCRFVKTHNLLPVAKREQ